MYLGNQPALSYTSFAKQDFTTSATTSYTLDNPVANENEIALFINFVRQEPTTAYTASGTTLTLTSATSASDDMYCVFLGKAVQTVNPPSGSVGTSQLVDSAVTYAKSSGFGKIAQIIQGTHATEVENTTITYADTGLTATITPSSTSSKILILVSQSVNVLGDNQACGGAVRLMRGATVITGGDQRFEVFISATGATASNIYTRVPIIFLDTPSSTSALTYKTQSARYQSGDAIQTSPFSIESTITLIEVLG